MASLEYPALLSQLFDRRRLGMELTLDRVRAARDRLGRLDERVPHIVQIGGTNGKGSTAHLVARCLEDSGFRVGVFSSPHLSSFRERFVVGGRQLSEEEVVKAAGQVLAVDDGTLTFFELATLIAATAFAAHGLDCAIYEVGMGGRFDATTALDAHVTAVTGVALDHEAQLGQGVQAIAREKAGVFRRDRPAIVGCSGLARGAEVLVTEANRRGARPVVRALEVPASANVGLAGAHQRQNAGCAWAVLDALAQRGLVARPTARASGISGAALAGRLEEISDGIWLDGAHNPHAARALAASVQSLPHPRHLVLGVSRGKDLEGICTALGPHFDAVWPVAFGADRAVSGPELASVLARCCPDVPVCFARDWHGALAEARRRGTVVVAGSLYLVGEVRSALARAPADGMDLSDPIGVGSLP